jgi:hypothetical protein
MALTLIHSDSLMVVTCPYDPGDNLQCLNTTDNVEHTFVRCSRGQIQSVLVLARCIKNQTHSLDGSS